MARCLLKPAVCRLTIVQEQTGDPAAYVCTTLATGVLSTSTTACNPSSLRFKDNVQDLSYGLDEVLKLKPVSFTYKPELKVPGNQVGFIAEDVVNVVLLERRSPERAAEDLSSRTLVIRRGDVSVGAPNRAVLNNRLKPEYRLSSARAWMATSEMQKPGRRVNASGPVVVNTLLLKEGRHMTSSNTPGRGLAIAAVTNQAKKIRRRLGDNDGLAFEGDPFPDKPKGMHWQTYRRLEERYEDLQARWTLAAMARFGFIR